MTEPEPEILVASDGYRLAYRTWGGRDACATVIVLSGIMSHSGWFHDVAAPIASHGIRVVALDRRGAGANEVERGNAPSPEALIEDVRLFVERFRPAGPVYLLGWCWGAVLAIATSLQLDDAVAGLIVAAPGVFPSAFVRDRIRDEQERTAERELDEVCVANPVNEEMFTDGAGLEFIRADPKRLREFTPRFFRISGKLGAIAATRIKRLRQPVLVLLAERDEAVDNERTAEAFSALPEERVRMRTLDSRHGIPFDAPEAFVDEVAAWVTDQVDGGSHGR